MAQPKRERLTNFFARSPLCFLSGGGFEAGELAALLTPMLSLLLPGTAEGGYKETL